MPRSRRRLVGPLAARPLGPARTARRVVRAARDAGATGIWANLLYLRPETREHFLEQLARDWPEQLPRYEALYARRAYLRNDLKKPVQELVADLRRRHGIRDRRTIRLEPAREEQLALAV